MQTPNQTSLIARALTAGIAYKTEKARAEELARLAHEQEKARLTRLGLDAIQNAVSDALEIDLADTQIKLTFWPSGLVSDGEFSCEGLRFKAILRRATTTNKETIESVELSLFTRQGYEVVTSLVDLALLLERREFDAIVRPFSTEGAPPSPPAPAKSGDSQPQIGLCA